MSKRKKIGILQRLPAEFLLIVIFPLIFLPVILYTKDQLTDLITLEFYRSILYYLLFGWAFLVQAFAFIYVYIVLKTLYFLVSGLRAGVVNKQPIELSPTRVATAILSAIFSILLVAVALAISIISVYGLYFADPQTVQSSSQSTMLLDLSAFGSYVPFSLHQLFSSEVITRLALTSYMSLGFALSVVFIGLMITKKTLFRQYVTSFIFIPFLSISVWYFLPVVSPSEMYRRDIFTMTPQESIHRAISPSVVILHPKVDTFLDTIEGQKSKIETSYFADTAFPSMHVAWGTIAVWFGAILWLPLGLVLSVWHVFNILGAVYSLQHFAIDIYLGLYIAAMSVFFVHLGFKYFGKHEFNDEKKGRDVFMVIDIMQSDRKKFGRYIKKVLTRLIGTKRKDALLTFFRKWNT